MTMLIQWSSLNTGERGFHTAIYGAAGFRSVCHNHDFAECFVVLATELIHQINGAEVVLKKGDAVFIRPDDAHGFRLDPRFSGQVLFNVAFPVDVMERLRNRFEQESLSTELFDREFPAVLNLPEHLVAVLLGQFALLQSSAFAGRLHLECFLLNLLLNGSSAGAGQIPDWLAYAYQGMEEPKRLCGGVAEFVRLCGRSPEHASRSLKKYYGCTPTELVTRRRLERAALLLRTSNLSIDEIAAKCGFLNLSYFYREFKAHYRLSPRRYRLQNFTPVL